MIVTSHHIEQPQVDLHELVISKTRSLGRRASSARSQEMQTH